MKSLFYCLLILSIVTVGAGCSGPSSQSQDLGADADRDIPADLLYDATVGDILSDGAARDLISDGAGDVVLPDTFDSREDSVVDACKPNCEDKGCGDDGCGGNCGICDAAGCDGLSWSSASTCVDGKCSEVQHVDCDDGHACTDDECIPAEGCSNVPDNGFCLIDESCIPHGQSDPFNLCRICSTESDLYSWSPAEDGAVCQSGSCSGPWWTAPGTCLDGACDGGGQSMSCDDGRSCTNDSCLPASGCSHQPQAGWCLADGVCVGDGQGNDANPCEFCDATVEALAWSPRDDGLECGDSICDGLIWMGPKVCQSGVCDYSKEPESCDDGIACTDDDCDALAGCVNQVQNGWCLIDGTCLSDGTLYPDDECLGCVATKSAKEWSTVADGSPCQTDKSCYSGNCLAKVTPGHGYGATGSCGSWNACTNPAGCAARVCEHFNLGPPAHFLQGLCSTSGLICDIFIDNWEISPDWRPWGSCDLPIVFDVFCLEPQN